MKFKLSHLAAGALMLGSTALAVPVFAAQTTSPAPDKQEFTAYVYDASCANLSQDKIREKLGRLDEDKGTKRERKMETLIGSAQRPVEFWIDDEDMDNVTLDELTATEHAVAIHETKAPDSKVVACGDISGTVTDGTLMIDLKEVDKSSFEGRAFIAPEDFEKMTKQTDGTAAADTTTDANADSDEHEDSDHGDSKDQELEFTIGIWPVGSVAP